MSRAYGRIGAGSAGNSTQTINGIGVRDGRRDDVTAFNEAQGSIRAQLPSLSERIISQVQEAIALADIADDRLRAVQNNILSCRDLGDSCEACGGESPVPATFEDHVLERLNRLLDALRTVNVRATDIRERL